MPRGKAGLCWKRERKQGRGLWQPHGEKLFSQEAAQQTGPALLPSGAAQLWGQGGVDLTAIRSEVRMGKIMPTIKKISIFGN